MEGFRKAFIGLFVAVGMLIPAQNYLFAATATIDTSDVHQTIEGFGASLAWEIWQLYSHEDKGGIYNYLFKELGMDILRLRNVYGKDDGEFSRLEEIVDSFYSLSENDPKILISSWTPPVDLKSNGSLVGGTLADIGGEYLYSDFTWYWVDALDEFYDHGIVPDYISFQNEPDWGRDHATCRFDPTENDSMAGYDQALDSIYLRLQGMGIKVLAPEVLGIGYSHFQNYADHFNHDHADGYAYHLYHGGDGNVNPDAFNSNLTAIASNYTGKPIFQTEYDKGDWFNTAWLIHNCLVYGNVSGYLYWALVWSPNEDITPIIRLNTSSIYTINHIYWALRQYSKAIHYGWKRVGATVDDGNLKITAFLSPGNNELSIVVINVGYTEKTLDLVFSPYTFNILGANMLRTSSLEKCDYIGNYSGSTLNLPARSITTISTLYIEDVSGVEEENYDSSATVSLSQNHPNPFNTTTTIEYSIEEATFVKLAVYDVSGREIMTLVEEVKPAGKYTVNIDAKGLSQGVYIYRLETGGKSIQKKMILVR
jgi:glucuronoarabinoxylan endo-1,4-beta-xylanase